MNTKQKPPKRIDLSQEDVEALLARVSTNTLTKEDGEIIKGLIETITYLGEVVDQKGRSVKKLLQMLFGHTTESSANVLANHGAPENGDEDGTASDIHGDPADSPSPDHGSEDTKKVLSKRNGRNSSAAYTGAKQLCVNHETLKPGDTCPGCGKGKVYAVKDPEVVVRIKGQAPLSATVYKLEKLRCNLCGDIFTALGPEDAQGEKYDETACSMLAILKYGTGMPFYRMQQLQNSLGVPLATSTQWDEISKMAPKFEQIYASMLAQASQGDLIHTDDTPACILEFKGKRLSKKQRSKDPPKKVGLHTTGIISKTDDRTIALYFSGTKHAGQNLEDLLRHRRKDMEHPLHMCDALSSNTSGDFECILSNCLAHARRNFVQIHDNFPLECRRVIEALAKVYKNDETARTQNLSGQERLELHQQKSRPVMDDLKSWMERQFVEKQVEPNSSLGDAFSYMLKRWSEFTLFLKKAGAPLDNNICERALKKAILFRKNSYFYKTIGGARVGDMFMSLIHTCEHCKANPFEYFNRVQKNQALVEADPARWMPWNYTENPPP